MLGKLISDIDVTISSEDLGEKGNFVKAASSGEITRLKSWHKHRDGHLIPVEISMGTLETVKNSLGFSFVRDITEHITAENNIKDAYSNLKKKNIELNHLYRDLSAKEKQLEYLAYHDVLTGLPNRTLFMNNLNGLIKEGKSKAKKSSILFIDIDNFKNINDCFGHRVGDLLLIETSKRMANSVRDIDTIYRFEGDEFNILLKDICSLEEIQYYSNKVKDCLLSPITIDGMELYLTCSIGVSVFPDHATSPEELLMYADTAMNKAKINGKNHIQFFNSEMKKEVNKKTDLQNKLRQAVMNHELFLQYQPQFNRKTGLIRGVEALVRWNNPYLGSISPSVFIPVAEEMGSIITIGEWVLKQACSDACKWEKVYNFNGYISVNISAKQLKNAGFVKMVKKSIEATGLNPTHLELEITESMFIDSFESAVSILMELKDLGIHICLDDFGTGYSSLGYLMQLPIDTLKIDKSFIEQIGTKSSKKNLTGSIVSLVNELKIETIVEGIETIEQFEYIMKTKTNHLQGYLLSRPVSEKDIGLIFQNNRQGKPYNGLIPNNAKTAGHNYQYFSTLPIYDDT